ncbi:putative protease U48 caax prenyl protease rce1 [Corchorus capsularis]|uniref:Putative protease U48 caax prenyl protease rce1 n=1 Tax=Corchorus capsularis TaxID=210143 RepID=A0A1R3IHW7_COCAP|nr:putative protease U48 caax prenyl protease rce1 [Corchorus capsularis]
MEESGGSLTKPVAVIYCIAMALFYVAILYAPTLILRLPPPQSFNSFMIRRFICAAVSSVASVIFIALILPIRSMEASYLFGVYGIRSDHLWQAVVFPLFLTSLMYAGSMMFKSMSLVNRWKEHRNQAHLNHMREVYSRHNYSLLKASMVIGLQLGYTVIFGSYASFLFIRTGNIVAPLVAHAFCNYMGLPVLFVQRKEQIIADVGMGIVYGVKLEINGRNVVRVD